VHFQETFSLERESETVQGGETGEPASWDRFEGCDQVKIEDSEQIEGHQVKHQINQS
jgi:hypothetical protein